MPLSTSSSKSWVYTWVAVIILVTSVIGVYEFWLSKNNHIASVENSRELWSWNRRLARSNPDAVVLVGASRIQLGIDTDVMRALLPDKDIIPLAINGAYPMATLKALAEDESFVGVVIVSFVAQMLEPLYEFQQQDHNEYFEHRASWYQSFDAWITAHIQAKLKFLHPHLKLESWVKSWAIEEQNILNFKGQMHVDTSISADYSGLDRTVLVRHFVGEKLKNYRQVRPMKQAVFKQQAHKLISYIETIKSRGAAVIVVRFPTDLGHWLLDQHHYPRRVFWEYFVTHSTAHYLHFKDDEILSSFDLPDSSHLDQVDATKFTARLVSLLKQQGALSQ